MGLESLKITLSGGAANADPALSTGGVKSSVVVLSQTAATTAIPGIVFDDAAGNAVGSGTFGYIAATKLAYWVPPSGTVGPAVSVVSSGTYVVRGAGVDGGHVTITVTSGALSAIDHIQTVTIADQAALLLPAVSKDTAYAGATEYFLFYIANTGATTIKTVAPMISVDTNGLDTLSISAISAKNTAELQAAASGHTYSAVGVAVTMGDLLTTDYWGFWIKRVIPALTVDSVTANRFQLKITALT